MEKHQGNRENIVRNFHCMCIMCTCPAVLNVALQHAWLTHDGSHDGSRDGIFFSAFSQDAFAVGNERLEDSQPTAQAYSGRFEL